MLVLGGVLVLTAALLAGVSGFGLGIVAVPLLLLAGFSLPFIVTAVLLISLATRVSVMWRLRRSINHRRVAVLTGAAVPGLFVGALFLRSTDAQTLRIAVGTTVALAAAGLAFAERYPPRPRLRGMNAAAGFAGGVLGTSSTTKHRSSCQRSRHDHHKVVHRIAASGSSSLRVALGDRRCPRLSQRPG